MASKQPVKNSVDYEKYLSNEIKLIINNINNDAYIGIIPCKEFTIEYFMLICMATIDCMLYKTLNTELTQEKIIAIYDELSFKYQNIKQNDYIVPSSVPKLTSTFKNILSKANEERIICKHDTITTDHILLMILHNKEFNPYLYNLFINNGITYANMLDASYNIHTVINDIMPVIIEQPLPPSKQSNKQKPKIPYCFYLNEISENAPFNHLIGRENEIEQLITVLGRKMSANPLLIGDEGVGKTAIIEGLVRMINDSTVPPSMIETKIFRLNIADMMNNTQFRGIFESKMNELLNSLLFTPGAILFIDNIHTMLSSAEKNEFSFIPMLTDALSDDKISIIATTTNKGFKTIFEKNPNFKQYFQIIKIDEMDKETCVKVIEGVKNNYQKFHNVKYSNNVINLTVDLSKRYISDKKLPSSALDIIDECGASKKMLNGWDKTSRNIIDNINKLKKEKDIAIRKDQFNDVEDINNNIEKEQIELIEYRNNNNKNNKIITEQDVYNAISKHTGISLSKISKSDKETLTYMLSKLKNKVIGQDEAIEKIAASIKRNKMGFSNTNKPTGSFLFIGKTGVGKTYLAKMIAEEIFGDKKYLVRFDMSEYSDKTAVNKLIGSSAGYVGYDNGGLLTEAVKHNKYCVLLFDEIEKSTTEIYNTLLQVLDEGFLTDNMGIKVDFRNTIIIMTSNVGAKESSLTKCIGFNNDIEDKQKSITQKELKKVFPPEFINRIDDIIYFNSLGEHELRLIIDEELYNVKRKLNEKNCDMDYEEDVIDYLYNIIKPEIEFGARTVKRCVEREIENKIVDILIEEDKENLNFNITIKDCNLKIKYK